MPDDDATWVEPVEGHDGIGFVDEEGDEVQVIRTWTVDRRLMLSVQEPIDEVPTIWLPVNCRSAVW